MAPVWILGGAVLVADLRVALPASEGGAARITIGCAGSEQGAVEQALDVGQPGAERHKLGDEFAVVGSVRHRARQRRNPRFDAGCEDRIGSFAFHLRKLAYRLVDLDRQSHRIPDQLHRAARLRRQCGVSKSAGIPPFASMPSEATSNPPLEKRRKCWMHPFVRSEEHTSELQSLMRISYAAF